jgi:hypothetical protein
VNGSKNASIGINSSKKTLKHTALHVSVGRAEEVIRVMLRCGEVGSGIIPLFSRDGSDVVLQLTAKKR